MGLKRLIREQQLVRTGVIDAAMTLPGEPLIYSIKYPIQSRTHHLQYFRNAQWSAMIKCFFRRYLNTNTPVVINVRFYVTPPESVKISDAALKRERTPATRAHELCDYTLSFLEILHKQIFNSYRQVVRLDIEKYYSANPRTVFQFMTWDNYVQVQKRDRANTVDTSTENVMADGEVHQVQSVQAGDAEDQGAGVRKRGRPRGTTAKGASSCDPTLSPTATAENGTDKEGVAAQETAHEAP